jgi:2-hydroxychromene-2-carboxylate isomerase
VGLEVVNAEPGGSDPEAVFFYDLGEPYCYLVAERIRADLPVICDWEPVSAQSLGLTPEAPPDPEAPPRAPAAPGGPSPAQGLLPLRLPPSWPPDTALAMRVATYAKGAGKSIAYSLAAFRQAFAGGRDLGDEGTVLLAAAACEMHPTAVLKGASLRSTDGALRRAAQRAAAAGVTALPAFALAGETVCGPDALDAALAVLARSQAR